jgi:hypothetical protein
MNNIFSILECCYQPKIKIEESMIKHTSTKKISNIPNLNKIFENKNLHNHESKNTRNNPFEQNKETTASNEFISPRFIEEVKYDKSSKISNHSKIKDNNLFSSLISFSNFPIQSIRNEKEDIGIIGPKLLCSGELFFEKEIIITSEGMIDGLRKKKDCQTFFGIKETTDYRGIYYNDFIINLKNENELVKQKESSTGRVFNISFQKKTRDFNLYMIHDSFIIYYEINDFVYFNNEKDYYLLLGNIFITIVTKKLNNIKGIDFEIEDEENENQLFSFNENDCPISIGRTNCKITISKPSISKVHGVIEFSKECNMFYYKDLGSTNGSILLIKEDDNFKLKGEMNFKLENISFKIMELP